MFVCSRDNVCLEEFMQKNLFFLNFCVFIIWSRVERRNKLVVCTLFVVNAHWVGNNLWCLDYARKYRGEKLLISHESYGENKKRHALRENCSRGKPFIINENETLVLICLSATQRLIDIAALSVSILLIHFRKCDIFNTDFSKLTSIIRAPKSVSSFFHQKKSLFMHKSFTSSFKNRKSCQ
jgi:hypothetical protein